MPAPTAYTEDTLAQYMRDTIESIADDLNWQATIPNGGDYSGAVQDVELRLGISDIALTTAPLAYVQLVARFAVWGKVVAAYVRAYAVGGLQQTLSRNQLFDHARLMLADARAELLQYEAQQASPQANVVVAQTTTSVNVVPVFR